MNPSKIKAGLKETNRIIREITKAFFGLTILYIIGYIIYDIMTK